MLTTTAHRFAWLATLLAALAAAVGLAYAPLYRDVPAMVDQAQAADLATLIVAVPVLVAALWLARRGSAAAEVVGLGALAYLVYTYAIFAFQVVVNPLTPVHIAILGLATWAVAFLVPSLGQDAIRVGETLPRRVTAGFLALVAILFAGLWLGQIVSAITSGTLPPSVTDLGLPTSAVYALDLAFVLPLLAAAAFLLTRRHRAGGPLALGGLVFSVLMALSILAIFGIQATRAELKDPSMPLAFGAIAAVAAMLAARGLLARDTLVRRASDTPELHA